VQGASQSVDDLSVVSSSRGSRVSELGVWVVGRRMTVLVGSALPDLVPGSGEGVRAARQVKDRVEVDQSGG